MWALLTTLFCSFLVCIYHVFISNSWYHLLKPHWYSIIHFFNITFLSGKATALFLAEMTRALCTCIQYTTTCALVCSQLASSGHSGTIEEVCNCAIVQLWNCAIVLGPFLAGAKIGACLAARPSFAYNPYKSRNLQAGTALLTHFWWNPKIPGDFLTLPILGMVGYGVLQSRENLFRPSKRKTWSWWTWKCGV